MAEKHGFESPENHRLCANNCGFFGSPATLNLCSKCYRDSRLKQEQDALAKAAIDSTNPSLSGPGPGLGPSARYAEVELPGPRHVALEPAAEETTPAQPGPVAGPGVLPNRCLTCSKRVGLTGFKCRCGLMFCGSHRYPEQHGCTFDYKTSGKEAIAKANPVIKAEKLEKI